MADHEHHCPFLNRPDPRCADRFQIDHLDDAFDFCLGDYGACPTYLERLVERRARRLSGTGAEDVNALAAVAAATGAGDARDAIERRDHRSLPIAGAAETARGKSLHGTAPACDQPRLTYRQRYVHLTFGSRKAKPGGATVPLVVPPPHAGASADRHVRYAA